MTPEEEKPPSMQPVRARRAVGASIPGEPLDVAGSLALILTLSVLAHAAGMGRFLANDTPPHLDSERRICRSGADVSTVDLSGSIRSARLGSSYPLPASGARAVERWTRDLRNHHPDVLRRYLERVRPRESGIRAALEAEGVPSDFVYLALIESRMDPEARSRAHAVGLWQFRSATARSYGLEVSSRVDERTHVEPSTRAAARYLRDLYDRFGEWELAAAAYNAGPTRVARALDRAGASSYWELHTLGALPRETLDYVPRLFAVTQLADSPWTPESEPAVLLTLARTPPGGGVSSGAG